MTFNSRLLTLAKRKRQYKSLLPPVLVMTDEKRLPDPVAVAASIPCSWGLIFRHYGVNDRDNLAKQTAAVCHRRGIVFLIAGDWRLADRVNANGVHLPEHMTTRQPLAPVQLWRQRGKLVTMSAHGAIRMQKAQHMAADAVVLSPVEATISHPDVKPLGALRFAALARAIPSPVYALGGITLAQHKRLQALGAKGIAGIGFLKEL